MQRIVYNVWGRQLRNREEANARAAKAQADNPRITNLHIGIIVYVEQYRTLVYYQARWYDRSVARKRAATVRSAKARIADAKVRHCDCCEQVQC